MRAIGLRKGATKAEELELPEPTIESPKQGLVQALQTGICGSDRSMIANGLADPPPGEDFIVMVHEGCDKVRDDAAVKALLEEGA